MKKNIVIASHNLGKVREMAFFLKKLNFNILLAKNFNLKEPKENGKTLSKEEALMTVNDIIKNVRLDEVTRMPVFKFGTRKIAPLNEESKYKYKSRV